MTAFATKCRKNTLLMLLFMLVMACPQSASAVDARMMGFTDVTMQWADTSFNRNASSDRFQATQRSRFWLQLSTSEYLKGMLMFEIDNIWGADKTGMRGGQLGTDGFNIGVKESYIDWFIPDTSIRVRMGLQSFILPGIGQVNPYTGEVDSVVAMWARGAGIIASGEINDNLGLTAFWMRPSNDNAPTDGKHMKDSADLGGLIATVKGDGFDIKPWAMFSRSGKDDPVFTYRPTLNPAFPVHATPGSVKNPSDYAEGWWAGFAANAIMFSPFRLGFEFNWGGIDGVVKEMDRAGWYTSLLAEYAMDDMIPGLLAWYSSGDDSDPWNGSERMPTILGNWYGSSMGFGGQFDNLGLQSSVVGIEPTGTWGVSLYLRDISFVENIKHTARVLYYRGTNSNEMARYIGDGYTKVAGAPTWLYLTKDDAVVETNLNTTWQIYKNLTWSLECGWMHLNRGSDWDIPGEKKNAVRLASTFRYMF